MSENRPFYKIRGFYRFISVQPYLWKDGFFKLGLSSEQLRGHRLDSDLRSKCNGRRWDSYGSKQRSSHSAAIKIEVIQRSTFTSVIWCQQSYDTMWLVNLSRICSGDPNTGHLDSRNIWILGPWGLDCKPGHGWLGVTTGQGVPCCCYACSKSATQKGVINGRKRDTRGHSET